MARLNISIPDELKARMDGLDVPMNWSQIASSAFEDEIRRQELSHVIERLSAGSTPDANSYKEGYRRGNEWAKNFASRDELDRILNGERPWSEQPATQLPQSDIAFMVIAGLGESHDPSKVRRQAAEFWHDAAGNDTGKVDEGFLEGFMDGATDLYEEILNLI